MSNNTPHNPNRHHETAVEIRFAPREVPLLLLLYFYQHVFHFIMPFVLCIAVCSLCIKKANVLNINDGGFAGEVRREIQTPWQNAGNAKVKKNQPVFGKNRLFAMFSETEFEYTDANGKQRKDTCGSFIHRFDAGKEYPLETLFDVFPRYRLTGTYSYSFFIMLHIIGFFGGFSLLYLLLILYFFRRAGRNIQLYRFGVAAVGTLAGTEKVFLLTRFLGQVKMLIDFQDEHDKKFRRRRLYHQKMMDKHFAEPPVVIYDADKPERFLLVKEFGVKTQYDWEKRTLILPAEIKAGGAAMWFIAALILAFIGYITVTIIIR